MDFNRIIIFKAFSLSSFNFSSNFYTVNLLEMAGDQHFISTGSFSKSSLIETIARSNNL